MASHDTAWKRLYHGGKRWRAKEDMAGLCAPSGERLAPYQPSQRYFVLDVGGYTDALPEQRNRMAELVRLASCRDPATMVQEFHGVLERLWEPEHDGLIKAFWEWLGKVHLPMYCPGAELPALTNPREAGTMLDDKVIDWTVQWRAEGQTALMRHQAARKFGAETAERLAGRLEEITDPERAVEVGEWLLECDSGEELLARVARLCKSSATGNGASPG